MPSGPLPCVLVVDDEALVRRAIARDLGGAFRVVEAATGDEAIARLGDDAIVGVISDWDLGPGPDGLAVLSQACDRGLARILISGRGSLDEVPPALRSGAIDRFISKPWNAGALRQALTSLLVDRGEDAPRADAAAAPAEADLAALRGGDEEATAATFHRWRRLLLWRILNVHGVPAADAEDVLQHTYERFLPYPVRLEQPLKLLVVIAESAAIDYHRRRAAESRALEQYAHAHGGPRAGSGEETLHARLDAGRALAAIKGRCYELLTAVMLLGRTHSEYASTSGTPRGTIGTAITNCLDKVRRQLARAAQRARRGHAMAAVPDEGHPRPDEIFLWISGHDRGTPEADALAAHLGACAACAEQLDASLAVSTDIGAALSAREPGPSLDERRFASFAHAAHARARADEGDAAALLGQERSTWRARLDAHPRRDRLDFLYHVAQMAAWYADEAPDAVLSLALRLDELAAAAAEPRTWAGPARALAALAEGSAEASRGDHVRALACYARGLRALEVPALAVEAPQLHLVRAAALRQLKRFDEARDACELARLGFARCGIRGQGKALWQLANIAWETGQARDSFRLACRAHRMLVRERNHDEATIMLLIVAMALLSLRRPSPARRLLRRLEAEPAVLTRPHQHARLQWSKANLAALEDDLATAMGLLADAAARFAAHGASLDAARVELDLAHVAGEAGDLARQAQAAARAAEILSALPGQQPDAAAAVALLRDALGRGAAVAQAVRTARERLGR